MDEVTITGFIEWVTTAFPMLAATALLIWFFQKTERKNSAEDKDRLIEESDKTITACKEFIEFLKSRGRRSGDD